MILKNLFSRKNPKKAKKSKSLMKSLRKIKKQELVDVASKSFQIANERIRDLEQLELSEYSRAVINFRAESGHQYFGETNKKRVTKYDILNELYAARNFIADITSTYPGVMKEIALLKASEVLPDLGYKQVYGTHHNPYKISQDTAKLAYAVYRRLEQYDRNLIYGKAGYGSETTIAISFQLARENAIDFSELSSKRKDVIIDEALLELVDYINANERTNDPYSIRDFNTDYTKINNLITNIRRGKLV